MPDDPTPPPPPAGATTDPPPAEPPAARTFTQDDVNRLLADQKRKLLADQPDLTELRRKASEFDKLDEASKTELQKANERALAAEQKLAEQTARAQAAVRRAAVVAAAQRAGAVDPDAVLALLPSDQVTIGDDGQVTGVDDAIKALLAAKPYLVGKPPTPTPGGADGGTRGATPGLISREDLKKMTPEQITEAHKTGQLNHLLT